MKAVVAFRSILSLSLELWFREKKSPLLGVVGFLYVTDFFAKSASTPGIEDILHLLPQMDKNSRAHISPIHSHHIRFQGMPFQMKYRNKSSFIYRVVVRGGRYQKWLWILLKVAGYKEAGGKRHVRKWGYLVKTVLDTLTRKFVSFVILCSFGVFAALVIPYPRRSYWKSLFLGKVVKLFSHPVTHNDLTMPRSLVSFQSSAVSSAGYKDITELYKMCQPTRDDSSRKHDSVSF